MQKLPSPICCANVEVNSIRLYGLANLQLCTFLSNATSFIQFNFLNLSQKIGMQILSTNKVHVRWKEKFLNITIITLFSSRPNHLELENNKNFLASKMDIVFLLPNHKPPMIAMLIYHCTKLLGFTSNTHFLYKAPKHTL